MFQDCRDSAVSPTALSLATRPTKADALRKAGASTVVRDKWDRSPVTHHAQQGNMATVKWFSRCRENLGVLDSNGNDELLLAAFNGRRDQGEEIWLFRKSVGTYELRNSSRQAAKHAKNA